MLAQQAAYGLRLEDLETMQKDMWVEQQQFHQDVHTAQEENKAKLNQINQVVLSHSLDSQAGNMNNFREGKPLFEGMLRPWPPEGSTSAAGQQDPPAVDVPRDQNADSDND
ncbi:hypothetical protein PIB30_108108 [Stylosanthes scabra]|uniref:Uncharacterized protein n=1 Tax=Stylosanthes scabra TaxID=79078 RepID=A0ABU6Y015_9FABA|nr:hypothetical protein [Stylosanthes scabra]